MDQNNLTNSNDQEPTIIKPDEVIKPEPVMQPMDNHVVQPEPVVSAGLVTQQPLPQIVKPDAGARPEDVIKPSPDIPQTPVQPVVTQEQEVQSIQQNPSMAANQNVQQPIQGQPIQQPVQQNIQNQPKNPNNWFNPQPNNQGNNNFNFLNSQPKKVKRKLKMNKKNNLMIFGGIFIIVVLLVSIFAIIFPRSKKLVCKADAESITITYNDAEITGYTAKDITFDMDLANEYVMNYGVEKYLSDLVDWFEGTIGGTCTKK